MKNLSLLFIAFLLLQFNIIAQYASLWDRVPEEIKETKQFKRFEWFYKQRAYPYDTIPRYQYIAERNKEISKIKNLKKVNQSGLSWSSIGPNGVTNVPSQSHWGVSSGRVTAIAVHPTDPLTVYIGAAAGGIWKTTNGGEDWEDIGADMESLTFGAIAGSIIGYSLSTEEYILQEIPPDYNWSILKPLARYQDEEPEYLRAIE